MFSLSKINTWKYGIANAIFEEVHHLYAWSLFIPIISSIMSFQNLQKSGMENHTLCILQSIDVAINSK